MALNKNADSIVMEVKGFIPLMLVTVQRSVRSAVGWMYDYDPGGSRSIPTGGFFFNLVVYNINNYFSRKLL